MFHKTPTGIMMGTAVNLKVNLGKVSIFTIMSVSLHKHDRHMNILTFPLNSLSNIL